MIKIENYVRDVQDFPKKGILFYDITPLLENESAFSEAIDQMLVLVENIEIDAIAAIESRGFIFASALCSKMRKGMILIRKPGKLPRATQSASYDLEYGQNSLEIHRGCIEKGKRVLIVDDLLATGGTAEAAGNLVKGVGGLVAGYVFFIELTGLKGALKLEDPVLSVLKFEV